MTWHPPYTGESLKPARLSTGLVVFRQGGKSHVLEECTLHPALRGSLARHSHACHSRDSRPLASLVRLLESGPGMVRRISHRPPAEEWAGLGTKRQQSSGHWRQRYGLRKRWQRCGSWLGSRRIDHREHRRPLHGDQSQRLESRLLNFKVGFLGRGLLVPGLGRLLF